MLTCVLAATAGLVDAVGFLRFSEVFVSFMSGNTTETAVTAAGGGWRDATLSLWPIVLYVTGCCLGALVAFHAGRRAFRVVLLVEAALLVGAALRPGGGDERSLAFVLVVLAMGVQNAALSRTDVAGVGVTYVTGTLAKVGRLLAARLTGSRDAGREALRLAALWLCFAGGGLVGGLGYGALGFATLWAPVLVLSALVMWSVVAPDFIEDAQDGASS